MTATEAFKAAVDNLIESTDYQLGHSDIAQMLNIPKSNFSKYYHGEIGTWNKIIPMLESLGVQVDVSTETDYVKIDLSVCNNDLPKDGYLATFTTQTIPCYPVLKNMLSDAIIQQAEDNVWITEDKKSGNLYLHIMYRDDWAKVDGGEEEKEYIYYLWINEEHEKCLPINHGDYYEWSLKIKQL